MSRDVLVDTGAIFALYVAEDRYHATAAAVLGELHGQRRNAILTSAILSEAFTLFRARGAEAAAFKFLAHVQHSAFVLIYIEPVDHARAQEILLRYRDKSFSYCNALSFAVMERLGIEEVIAYDRHFRGYGQFKLL